MIKDLLSVFYPNLCISCNSLLLNQEYFLCTYCYAKINFVPFSSTNLPYLEERFYGKFSFVYAQSLLLYEHDNISKNILHHLKYKNMPEIGTWLAEMVDNRWQSHPLFSQVDGIIKIPIHKYKLKIRGYNQLDFFALSLSNFFNIPIIENAVIRSTHSLSQTYKNISGRLYRDNIFQLTNPSALEGKHILILDDVVTTGSTMEQIAKLLSGINDVKISVYAIATAK